MGALPSDCLMSYPENSLGQRSYPSVVIQSVFSVAPADWANHRKNKNKKHMGQYYCNNKNAQR